LREIYVGETDRGARDEAGDHWLFFWERYGGGRRYGTEIRQPENLASVTREQRRKELLDVDLSIKDNSFICGSPETVTRQIQQIASVSGADCFLGDFAFGALEHARVMESLELFVEHVMPELKTFEINALSYPCNGYRFWLKEKSARDNETAAG
jgi:alkanesulfonate monooxygenase SsuD/methylene tetrahydromethanopterin reductase-like flavin-dependent oxidoreductase (luciferase family)